MSPVNAPVFSSATAAVLSQAVILHQQKNFIAAARLYQQVLSSEPENPDALHLLGAICRTQGHPEAAITFIKAAISLRPNHPSSAYYNLGNALCYTERWEEAVHLLRQALLLGENNPACLALLGVALYHQGEHLEAAQAMRTALAQNPQADHPDLLAVLLGATRQLFDAAAGTPAGQLLLMMQRELAALAPHRPIEQGLLGLALHFAGRLPEAIATMQAASRSLPDLAILRHMLGMSLIQAGRFAEGYAACEWRQANAPYRDPVPTARPVWDGAPCPEAPVLILAEGGLGDSLQYSRFVLALAGRGQEVIFLPHNRLTRFFRHAFAGLPRLALAPERLPASARQRLLLSLPLLLNQTDAPPPVAQPYLRAEPDMVARWRQRLDTPARPPALRVGLAWWGGASNVRSIPSAALAPLCAVPGVRFISLHNHTHYPPLPAGLVLETLAPDLDAGPDALIDTAAVMMNLDLVITLDTSLAHLAGGLGRPVWVLLKFMPDCRWGTTGATTPWYPTMRLYRQEPLSDWETVLTHVAADLRQRVAQTLRIA